MYDICTEVVDLMVKKPGDKKIAEIYSQLEKISVESAVTEHAEKIAMSVSNRIGWSDLGKWHVIKRVLDSGEKSNLTKGEVMVKSPLAYPGQPANFSNTSGIIALFGEALCGGVHNSGVCFHGTRLLGHRSPLKSDRSV